MPSWLVDAFERAAPGHTWHRGEPLERMVELEPTVDLERKLDAARQRLGNALLRLGLERDALTSHGDDEYGPPSRSIRDADAAVNRVLELVKMGRRRDLHALAFGCWCLGLGGRGQRVAFRPGLGVLDVDGETVTCLERYCECPIGQQLAAEAERLTQIAIRQAEAARLGRLWCRVPSDLRGVSLESYPAAEVGQRHALEMCCEWSRHRSPWLWLYGPAGVGKSGLALGAAAATGDPWAFVTVTDLLARLRQTFDHDRSSRDAVAESDVLNTAYSVDLLILDDLGAQRATDWADEVVYQVVYHRHAERRRTVITSNQGPGEIEARLGAHGERVLSRILGAAGDFVVRVDGPDLRQVWRD